MYRLLALRDSLYRTLSSASAAINASISVDFVMSITLGDSLAGALSSASATVDALIGNFVSHNYTSKKGFFDYCNSKLSKKQEYFIFKNVNLMLH